jgi:hypothetical protein
VPLTPVQDRFDSASRYLIKLHPDELIRWRLKGDVEDWNVTESLVVRFWEAKRLQRTLRLVLEDRFGSLPESVREQIDACDDPDRLEAAVRKVSQLASLNELTI